MIELTIRLDILGLMYVYMQMEGFLQYIVKEGIRSCSSQHEITSHTSVSRVPFVRPVSRLS